MLYNRSAQLQVEDKLSIAHTVEQERQRAAVAAEQDRLAARAEYACGASLEGIGDCHPARASRAILCGCRAQQAKAHARQKSQRVADDLHAQILDKRQRDAEAAAQHATEVTDLHCPLGIPRPMACCAISGMTAVAGRCLGCSGHTCLYRRLERM